MKKYLKIIVLIFAVILVAGCAKNTEEEKEKKKEVTVEEVVKQGKEKCVASSKLVYTQFKKDFKVDAKDAACYLIRTSDGFGYASIVMNDINNHTHSYVIFNDSETGLEKTSSTTSDSTLYDEGKCASEEKMSALEKAKCLLAKTAREHYDKYVNLSKEEAKSVYGTFAYIIDVSEFK